VRDLIRSRRHLLTSETAPARVRARAESLPLAARRASTAGLWRWPLAAAAVLVLAFAGLRMATGSSTVVLAAQLTADHVKCHWLQDDRLTRTPAAVHAALASRGFDMPVPPGSSDGRLRLVGGRRCLTGEGRDAHILYRYDGRRVSLFLIPHDARRPQTLDLLGSHTVMWPRPKGTYVLVADGSIPSDAMPALAAYMRSATAGRPENER
jgi:hypothetical protein